MNKSANQLQYEQEVIIKLAGHALEGLVSKPHLPTQQPGPGIDAKETARLAVLFAFYTFTELDEKIKEWRAQHA